MLDDGRAVRPGDHDEAIAGQSAHEQAQQDCEYAQFQCSPGALVHRWISRVVVSSFKDTVMPTIDRTILFSSAFAGFARRRRRFRLPVFGGVSEGHFSVRWYWR